MVWDHAAGVRLTPGRPIEEAMDLYLGKEVWSPQWGRGIVVRLDTAWDAEVLYGVRTHSLLYYGLAWGHNRISGDRFEPPLLEWP